MNILKFSAPEYTKIEGIMVNHKGSPLAQLKTNCT